MECWSIGKRAVRILNQFSSTPVLHYSIKKVLKINAERRSNMADKVIIYGKSS
jgi:hypothetical protein